MTQRFTLDLSILLIHEGDAWVVQCLDYDINAQGETIAEAKKSFERTLRTQVSLDLEAGRDPLSLLEKAPPRYWEMYYSEDAQALVVTDDTYFPNVPPAFVIRAITQGERVYGRMTRALSDASSPLVSQVS